MAICSFWFQFVPLGFMDTAAARHVHSVYTAVAPATILLDYVTAYLDLLEPSVMKVQAIVKTLWGAETRRCFSFRLLKV